MPLTYEDFLYPQEGDVLPQGLIHSILLHPWAGAVRRFLKQRRPSLLVTCGVFLRLSSDGRNSAPDIAVIDGDVEPDDTPRTVDLAAVGGRLVFAFEPISDSDKEVEAKDLEINLRRYAAEGVLTSADDGDEDAASPLPDPPSPERSIEDRRVAAGEAQEVAKLFADDPAALQVLGCMYLELTRHEMRERTQMSEKQLEATIRRVRRGAERFRSDRGTG